MGRDEGASAAAGGSSRRLGQRGRPRSEPGTVPPTKTQPANNTPHRTPHTPPPRKVPAQKKKRGPTHWPVRAASPALAVRASAPRHTAATRARRAGMERETAARAIAANTRCTRQAMGRTERALRWCLAVARCTRAKTALVGPRSERRRAFMRARSGCASSAPARVRVRAGFGPPSGGAHTPPATQREQARLLTMWAAAGCAAAQPASARARVLAAGV